MTGTAAAQHDVRAILTTPTAPGAIALIQLHGHDCPAVLGELTGRSDWPIGTLRLVRFADIDEGLAGCVTDRMAELMPHGGPRVVQRLMQRLREIGVQPLVEPSPMELYPEAADRYEALMLAALARAASPLAIEPLLAQPAIWRSTRHLNDDDRKRSRRLDHLLAPPVIVLAGAPNVGKSTLSNALLGRSMSISLDMPGTTRDYTAARIDLAGLVVHWHDTPGLRETADAIETRAIDLARRLISRADLLLALTDHEHDWPPLPRSPHLRIASKCDLAPRNDADINISAATGEGLEQLVTQVRDTLLPAADLAAARERPWLFDARLMEMNDNAPGEDVPRHV